MYKSLLQAGTRLKPLQQVHSQIITNGLSYSRSLLIKLITLACSAGSIIYARQIFLTVQNPDSFLFSNLIKSFSKCGYPFDAIVLYQKMRTFGLIQSNLGTWVQEYINGNGFDVNVILGTSLINMYSRCGNVGKAREIFNGMRELNVITWTAMISGYGMHGYGNQAMELFYQMKVQGPKPNDVTFVAVLSACAHAGLVDEGRKAFDSMKKNYGFVPRMEHHVCMVDLLGKAGLFDEALEHIQSVPGKPAPAIWTALLGSCKMHKNFDLGVKVAEQLLGVEPDNPAHYVLLSNIYASAGRMDRVEMVREIVINKGLKKQIGYSSVEIDHATYTFFMGDKSHPETTAIYQYLDELMRKLKQTGYVPEQEPVMFALEEEEGEFALRYHSEKLAIAFGLMNSRDKTTVRIFKNLRMCIDCHSAIKFISIVTDREIIVRDKHRFHHFKQGVCSCRDYW
ncbi:hypothetical protein C5167_039462 [Papaver somniferum]|uniref:DYW domain-containing protein n=2 Tax=Papaver somniferum TaxID=3469 RepID=A0A4Y7ICD2_PAPSO|nr:hypothetical protein C5167_039462 [Papaver somniferum]